MVKVREYGKEGASSTGSTSFGGKTIGNIKLVTDGVQEYTITGDNQVHEGAVESNDPYSRTFTLDERAAKLQADASRSAPSSNISSTTSVRGCRKFPCRTPTLMSPTSGLIKL